MSIVHSTFNPETVFHHTCSLLPYCSFLTTLNVCILLDALWHTAEPAECGEDKDTCMVTWGFQLDSTQSILISLQYWGPLLHLRENERSFAYRGDGKQLHWLDICSLNKWETCCIIVTWCPLMLSAGMHWWSWWHWHMSSGNASCVADTNLSALYIDVSNHNNPMR